ncbi:vWA domain-containing protein [Carboxylicivirga sp. N1Y90]|uniref:vWA domain-containing protein n=1 Tax=Carboxylicivirga fragile TaxID=3417571 RepID=UPI003D353FFB|nr:VWA domain-containing protein [Marinilabiliaceae bacterium N1Y90]
MSNITFAQPLFFILLAIVPLYIAWYVWKQKGMQASLQISTLKGFSKAPVSKKIYLRHSLFAFRVFTVILLITALARPQSSNSFSDETTEGIDIMLALDISSSMLAEDFKPNRFEAAKQVAADFVKGRNNDKIGLVIYAAESFTQCPLTTDHNVLHNLFLDIKMGLLEDGTAIGMGLATAVQRIKDSDAKSKVIILLTDGENNRGEIAPLTAAEIAKTFGVRVYTIGVGTIGMAPYPVETVFGKQYQQMEVKIDEELLQEIANLTDGKYFRATDKNKLNEIYTEIDKMEKTRIEVREYTKRKEEYFIFALLAGLFLLLEVFLRNTVFRNLP